MGRPAATYGLPVALSTALYASTCLLSNTVLLLASNSYGSSICACPTPVDPASPAHLPPAVEHSLQKQGGAMESDSEPMVSDMIQQQLTDLCFREIGSWTDRISQKSMFHHDKQNVGSFSLKHYTFKNHCYCGDDQMSQNSPQLIEAAGTYYLQRSWTNLSPENSTKSHIAHEKRTESRKRVFRFW